MTDILIRGMEMPNNCMVCDFRNRGFDLNGDLFCNCKLTKENVPDYYNIRMENCPLHELPEHGDLIDRDAVEYTYAFHTGVLMTSNKILDKLPAIVGADKELLEKAHKEFIEEASKNRAVKYEQEVKSMRDVALELRDEARQIKDGNAPVIVPSNKEVSE